MRKKHRNILIFMIITVFVCIVIFSSLSSDLVRQLHGPTEGTDSVLTVGNRLIAISKDNHLFSWQWNDLSVWPVVAKPQAISISLIEMDRIVYNPSSSPTELVLTDLKAEEKIAYLSLPYGAQCKKIKTSSNDKFGLASMIFSQGTQKGWFKLAVFDSDFKNLLSVFQKDTAAKVVSVDDFTITNDGKFIAVCGEEQNAWICVSDTNSQKILWEKTVDDYGSFTLTEFSPDGQFLFAAEKVRQVLIFDAVTGELIKKFVMDEYQTPSNQKQNISSIDISPDGKILAADTEPAGVVWFWDITSGQKIGEIHASDLTVSDIAFSPDSKYIASGCLVAPEIKIWKVPQLKK